MSGYEIATVSLLSCLVCERLICYLIPSHINDENVKNRYLFYQQINSLKNIEDKVTKIENIVTQAQQPLGIESYQSSKHT